MRTEIRNLLLLFVLAALAKGILSYFIPSISAFSDEYYYAKLARSFFFSHEFSLHEIKVMFYQPLYPVVLDARIAHPIPVREKVPARDLRLPAWDYAVLNPAAGLDAQLDKAYVR